MKGELSLCPGHFSMAVIKHRGLGTYKRQRHLGCLQGFMLMTEQRRAGTGVTETAHTHPQGGGQETHWQRVFGKLKAHLQ